MRKRLLAGLALALLVACSKSDTGAGGAAKSRDVIDVKEAPPPLSAPASGQPIKVALPQIAYTYSYAFRIPAAAIDAVESGHMALCDRMGPARCHVLAMERSGGNGSYRTGSMKLAVASSEAAGFGRRLQASIGPAGGETIDSGISAEDLSKQIVDTDARIRAKQALADRLLAVLRTHQGSIADLVAAERAYADVQQDIDTAQSELADARGRVAMSTFDLSYQSAAQIGGGAFEPVRQALGGGIANAFGGLLAILLYVLVLGGTLAIAALAAFAGMRRLRPAFRRWTGDPGDPGN